MRKCASAGEVVQEGVKQTTKFLKSHIPEIAGALVGAAALSAVQYQASKPGVSGTSAEQRGIASMSDAHKKSLKNSTKEGRKPGFKSDFAGASIDSAKPFADLLAKHPGKGSALFAGPLGASTGWQLAKLLK